jgi:hypothetical protein
MPLADIYGYRGIEYSVHEAAPSDWKWKYYPKVERGPAKGGMVKGDRDAALAAVKSAIDEFVGPSK